MASIENNDKKNGTKESAREYHLAQLNVDFNSFLCFLNKTVVIRATSGSNQSERSKDNRNYCI